MEEENDLFSLCIKDGTLKIGDSTKNRYVHNCSVVLPASGLISLQQNIIESNKLNFMMKYHFDFLPTKF